MAELELREVPATDWAMIERIGELRVRAWRTEVPQAAGMTAWLDEFDRIARHWAFFMSVEPVAAARLSVHSAIEDVPDSENYVGVFDGLLPSPIGSFNRLVVDPSVRGIGLGERLDRIRLDAAERMGCRCLVGATPSGERRVRHMVKLGFVVEGQGMPYKKPPLCHLPPPTVLVCYLPNKHQKRE